MNRKIMDGLSYGFYFVIICLIFLVVYLLFFKGSEPKNNNKNTEHGDNSSTVVNESIKLNKTNISLDIGGTFDLKVTLVPSNGDEIIKYESSDENIVKVSEFGKITAVSAGQAIIVVTVEGTNLKAECNVSVSDKVITATGIFVNNEKVEMKVGETYQLNVTVIPVNATDKTLMYSSNDETILTVDENGLVTANKEGNGRIFIKSNANPDVQIFVSFRIE